MDYTVEHHRYPDVDICKDMCPNFVSLDCIIFGLQKHGGISNYWAHLLDSFRLNPDWVCHAVIPRKLLFDGYKFNWLSNEITLCEKISPSISRFLTSPIERQDSIFHTSYYRLPSKKPYRYIVTAYDFMYELYRTGPSRWIHSWQKRRSVECADVVACISSFTRDKLLEFYPGINPEKAKVVHLGVDTSKFFSEKIPSDSCFENTVLFVGTRDTYKRFDLVVRAVRALSQLSLGIVGPSLSNEECDFLNSQVRGRWHQFGTLPLDRLRQLYSSAYALVVSSDCEGFGLTVLEAMACECPVVASYRASLPEVGGPAACYVKRQCYEDYSSALQSLAIAEQREKVIGLGRLQVNEFSWARTIKKTYELYQNI